MNCANHPDTPVSAYCQFCGKPLCAQCAHKINNIVGCEPCLAARVNAASGIYGAAPANEVTGFQYPATGPIPPGGVQSPATWGTEPWVAFALGWIPGVGAMYNGQFAKALVHVFVFAILVNLSHHEGLFGIGLLGWIFYQVFDAYQTAIARRDGLPLPNPLGLNDIGHWLGAKGNGSYSGSAPGSANPFPSNAGAGFPPPGAGPVGAGAGPIGESRPMSGFAGQYSASPAPPPVNPVSPNPYNVSDFWGRGTRGIPTGAVILIVVGIAFLLGNLGILNEYWMDRGWPILLIVIGVWLVIRRSHIPPSGGAR